MENAECLRTFVGHTSTVEALCVTEEGSLFTGSSDYTAKRWPTMTITEERSLKAARRPGVQRRDLTDPALTEEGELGTYGGDPRDPPYDKRKPDTFGGTKGHIFTVKCVQVKDKYLYTGSMDETVREWDIESYECLREFCCEAMVYNLEICRDFLFVSAVGDATARMIDLCSGKHLQTFRGHTGDILDVSSDEDGYYLFTSSTFPDACIKQWETKSGRCVRTIAGMGQGAGEKFATQDQAHTQAINAICYRNGRLFSASDDSTVKEWNERGVCERTFTGHKAAVTAVSYFEGKILTASKDRTAALVWAYPHQAYTEMVMSETTKIADSNKWSELGRPFDPYEVRSPLKSPREEPPVD